MRHIICCSALACMLTGTTLALPEHPYFITIGGGAGYNDWGPIIGHAYGEPGGIHAGGQEVFEASPQQAGGFDATGTAGFGLEISKHFKIQADYFYFSHTNVQFWGHLVVYPEITSETKRHFKTYAQAGDLSMIFAINLIQRFDLGAYVGAGIGLVNRKDILANTNRYGGSFSAGLTHRLNKNFSASLGMNYFTGYDKAEVQAAYSYVPFLYSTHFSLNYNFG